MRHSLLGISAAAAGSPRGSHRGRGGAKISHLFEMAVVVITSEREKIFLTFFSIVVDERKFIKHFGVDYQLVWDVVQEKLPELKRNVQSIIDKLQHA
jgi:hypothetical protein